MIYLFSTTISKCLNIFINEANTQYNQQNHTLIKNDILY
jgi:hypothetical protein